MNRLMAAIEQASLWVAMVGCAGNVPPADVVGTHADLVALRGTWEGDYEVMLTTAFSAQLRADQITGEFRVRHSDGLLRETGRWSATRKNRK